MNNRFTPRDYTAALAVVVLWGLNFVAMKFALRDFTPFQLGAARYVFAVLPLIFLVRRPSLPWQWLLLYGLSQGVGQFGFLFSALQVGMTASLASVLMQTQVFFTAIFSYWLLREKPSRPLAWGLALAACALLCFGISVVGGGALAAVTGLGLALNLCAAAMWAASNLLARRAQTSAPTSAADSAPASAPRFDPLGFVVWSSLVPVLPFCLMSYVFDAPSRSLQWLQAPWTSWVAVAYLGWLATILAYALWTGLLTRHAANRVAPFSLGVPVVGLTTGMWVLGETISTWQWGGIAFVMAALACVLVFGRR